MQGGGAEAVGEQVCLEDLGHVLEQNHYTTDSEAHATHAHGGLQT